MKGKNTLSNFSMRTGGVESGNSLRNGSLGRHHCHFVEIQLNENYTALMDRKT